MRMIIDIYPDQLPEVIELDFFIAVSGGRDDSGAPVDLYIFTRETGQERGEYFGQYHTDGTAAGYKAAAENYRAAAEQITERGYIRASQLINFEIW